MTSYRDINDEEWQRVVDILPELRPRREMRGRPLANTREVLNGVLWVIYSGSVWSAMPRKYPSYQTCHRRFLAWNKSGVMKRLLDELYGSASETLCKTIQERMRGHSVEAVKAARLAATLRALDAPPLAPTVQPAPRYPESLKQAA